jgi:hypothetical protein
MKRLILLALLACVPAFAQVFDKPASPVAFDPATFGANSTPAPDSYYHIDEGSGTTLENIGKDAGSFDCTINGSDWGTDDGSDILTHVSANSDSVECAIPGITAYPFTLAVWVKKTVTGKVGLIINVGDASGNSRFGIGDTATDRANIQAENSGLDSATITPSGDSNILDVWHLVVVAFDSATSRRGYVKDVAGGTGTGTGTVSKAFDTNSDVMRLGVVANSGTQNFSDESIAGFAVWKGVALTADQITVDLWNSGAWPSFVETSTASTATQRRRRMMMQY